MHSIRHGKFPARTNDEQILEGLGSAGNRGPEYLNYGLRSRFNRSGAHPGLFLHYHRCAAAERQERRHFRGLRRTGQPDGVRPPRRGQRALQSHHLVSDRLYDHFHYFVGLCHKTWRTDLRFIGPKIAARQDSACANPSSSHAALTAKVAAQSQFVGRPSTFLIRFGPSVPKRSSPGKFAELHLSPLQSLRIYSFPGNCICQTEDVTFE